MSDRSRGSRGEVGGPKTLQRSSDLVRRRSVVALCSLLAAGCGSPSRTGEAGSSSPPPLIERFTSAASAVHVGESTELTAVFSGEGARIDGIGPVESGVPVATPPLARTTTFTLTAHRGSQQVEARLTVAATYRDRFRPLAPSPVAYTGRLHRGSAAASASP